jgi:hypothetical protein
MVSALARPMYVLGRTLRFWGRTRNSGAGQHCPGSSFCRTPLNAAWVVQFFPFRARCFGAQAEINRATRVEHRVVLGKEDERYTIVITDRKPPRRVSMCRGSVAADQLMRKDRRLEDVLFGGPMTKTEARWEMRVCTLGPWKSLGTFAALAIPFHNHWITIALRFMDSADPRAWQPTPKE